LFGTKGACEGKVLERFNVSQANLIPTAVLPGFNGTCDKVPHGQAFGLGLYLITSTRLDLDFYMSFIVLLLSSDKL
jgi:hypothetical protein